jgi:lipid A 3-O-deacylase
MNLSRGCFLGRITAMAALALVLVGYRGIRADAPGSPHPGSSQRCSFPETRTRVVPGAEDDLVQGTRRIALAIGHGLGPAVFGSTERHDMLVAAAQIGWITSPVLGQDRFYRGNWEVGAEFMGGWQYHPRGAYLAGAMPTLRYHVATGTRWVPFAMAGAGILLTDIGEPDLATTFEFHLLTGVGVNYRITPHLALGLATRFAHISNAGIEQPNSGVNTFQVLTALTWFCF